MTPMHWGRAPGRLDIIGGNGDYSGGLVFVATIREATWAGVRLRKDSRIVLRNPQVARLGWQAAAEFHLESLETEEAVRKLVNAHAGIRWTAYVLGVFYLLRTRFPGRILRGANLDLHSEVPMNKGVSSSAALEVAVAKTAAHAYGIDLRGVELAGFCQYVENAIAQSACGIMDQVAVVLGEEDSPLPLVCQPCTPLPPVRLPEGTACWGIDSGITRQVSGSAYEAARAAAFMGYKLICDWERLAVAEDPASPIPRWTDPRWNGYLANLSPAEFRARYEHHLPEELTAGEYLAAADEHVDPFTQLRPGLRYRVRANARYAVEENERVRQFVTLAREGGQCEAMGRLMYLSHQAYTDCGLGSEATDELVDMVREAGPANGLCGARMSGGGGGGTVVVLGRKSAFPALEALVLQPFAKKYGFRPYVFQGGSPGADAFGVRLSDGFEFSSPSTFSAGGNAG